MPYASGALGLRTATFLWLLSMNGFVLVVLCGNVALLMFARAAARETEIVVRNALGASRRSVILAIFLRPLVQVALGTALGGFLMVGLRATLSGPGYGPTASDAARIVGFAAVMLGVFLLACIVPTRRALAVELMDALRAE